MINSAEPIKQGWKVRANLPGLDQRGKLSMKFVDQETRKDVEAGEEAG